MAKGNIDIKIDQINRIKYHVVTKNLTEKNDTNYSYKVPISSKLVLEFKGKDNANVIINTLRRVVLDDIPTYAFCSDLIKITENNTIFNNDYMRLRLSQLPVLNVDFEPFYLDQKYWLNVDYSDPKRNKHPQEKQIDIAINVYNDTNQVKNITTNDIHYYEDGVEMNKYNKECPILLVQLRPAETFKCSMKACLGVGDRDNIWAGASAAYYDDLTTDEITGNQIENKDNRTIFTIESQGQYDEYVLLIKACKFIIKKINDVRDELEKRHKNKEIVDGKELIIVLDGEDHTLGQLMNYMFQNHPDIESSGMGKPDHSIKSIRFKIACSDKLKTPLVAMYEQMDHIIELYTIIEQHLIKLSGITKNEKDETGDKNEKIAKNKVIKVKGKK